MSSGPTRRYEFRAEPRLVLDLARERVTSQLSAAESLDTRIVAHFAGGSALIGIVGAVLAFGDKGIGVAELATLCVALLIYTWLAVVAAIATWPRSWRVGPQVEWAWTRSQQVTEDEFVPEMIAGYVEYWKSNDANNLRKSLALKISNVAVLLEVACLVAALVIVAA